MMKWNQSKTPISGIKVFSVLFALLFFFFCLPGCGKKGSDGTSGADADQGDIDKLVLITPHHQNIRYEFEQAFVQYYQENFGKKVELEWRDVGGGSSSILRYLQNVYERSDTAEIDILFGGGEYPFQFLDNEGLLEPLTLQDDVLVNIPAVFGGMELYSKKKTWCGNVLSSFGFLYNKQLLEQLNIKPPTKWEDLASDQYFNMSVQGDPTQSGSTAAAFEMIVQSEAEWHAGWAKLLSILSNTKKFTESSGAAANAPGLGEAVVSVCIDFYGTMRVADAPDKLGYISPKGQTGYTPDPIGILKNPPHPQAAQRFVDFLLSIKGQALWALPVGHPDGPEKFLLNRTPIRKDFYTIYDEDTPEWIARPYSDGAEMTVDAELRSIRYGVLAQLVRAAAMDNLKFMKDARKKLIDRQYPKELMEIFYQLPENIDTNEEVYQIAEDLKDTAKAEIIVTDWTTFFRQQYKKVLE